MISDNERRELTKVLEALNAAVRHHQHQGEANAALHLSPEVLYNPLTVKIMTARNTLQKLLEVDNNGNELLR